MHRVFHLICVRKCPPELFCRGKTTCPRTHFHIRLWDIYIRLWDQNSNMVSFCVFIFLRLKVFPTFTLHKKNVERVWGYRVLERIKTHRLRPTPALYDPQTYDFFVSTKRSLSVFLMFTHHILIVFQNLFDQNLERVSAQLLCF